MNKRRKILTVVALAMFGAIILFHYGQLGYQGPYTYYIYDWPTPSVSKDFDAVPQQDRLAFLAAHPLVHRAMNDPGRGWYIEHSPLIKDVRMPLFVLAVFYTGLFFILGSAKNKKSSE